MLETQEEAVSQLERKGVHFLEKMAFIPVDHGCGNKSFGRLDLLRGKGFQLFYVSIEERKLHAIIQKEKAFSATKDEIRNKILSMKGARQVA